MILYRLSTKLITINTLNNASECNNSQVTTMTETNVPNELKNLEDKLDQLIERYRIVKNENNSLKIEHETLVQEKAQLLEKSILARTRVEAMITRLKAMEHGS